MTAFAANRLLRVQDVRVVAAVQNGSRRDLQVAYFGDSSTDLFSHPDLRHLVFHFHQETMLVSWWAGQQQSRPIVSALGFGSNAQNPNDAVYSHQRSCCAGFFYYLPFSCLLLLRRRICCLEASSMRCEATTWILLLRGRFERGEECGESQRRKIKTPFVTYAIQFLASRQNRRFDCLLADEYLSMKQQDEQLQATVQTERRNEF